MWTYETRDIDPADPSCAPRRNYVSGAGQASVANETLDVAEACGMIAGHEEHVLSSR